MTQKQAQRLVDKFQEEGDDKARIYEGYSGRFMYGEKTFGVVCSTWSVPEKCKWKVDNLGLQMILY